MTHYQHKRCSSRISQTIQAPLPLVWSVVRQFDQPQAYKKLVLTCTLILGSGEIGSIRQVMFRSGVPGKISIEQLEKVDEEKHVLVYKVIDGDHKLVNFHVTITLHEVVAAAGAGKGRKTVVTESYTVDVPEDSNEVDTRYFANTIIELNLKNLALVVENMAACINI